MKKFAEKVVRHRESIKTCLTSTSLPLRQTKVLCECKLGRPLFACAASALVPGNHLKQPLSEKNQERCILLSQKSVREEQKKQTGRKAQESVTVSSEFLTQMSDSKFGFSFFAEQWNGRLAMLGFVIGLGTELLTGQGILSQVGLG